MTNQPNEEPSSWHEESDDCLPRDTGGKTGECRKENCRRQKGRKHKWVIRILGIIAVIIAVAVLSVICMVYIGQWYMRSQTPTLDPIGGSNTEVYDDAIVYKGTRYSYNDRVVSILCIGVDRQSLDNSAPIGKAGQADALFLITVDTSNGRTVITAIPRDTITGVDLYTTEGMFIKTENRQICLAYANGDGTVTSCENTLKSASRLFRGIPINQYVCIDLQAVGNINDLVGGVDVVPSQTQKLVDTNGRIFYIYEGQTIHLTKDTALPYLRFRGTETEASYVRMERQIDYMKIIGALVSQKVKNDLTFPVKMYRSVSGQMVSNLDVTRISYLTSVMFSRRNDLAVTYRKLEGTLSVGEDGYAELTPDEDKLMDLIMDLFYTPV